MTDIKPSAFFNAVRIRGGNLKFFCPVCQADHIHSPPDRRNFAAQCASGKYVETGYFLTVPYTAPDTPARWLPKPPKKKNESKSKPRGGDSRVYIAP